MKRNILHLEKKYFTFEKKYFTFEKNYFTFEKNYFTFDNFFYVGGLAQSEECVVRNDEAAGSKPAFSTVTVFF